MQKLDLTGKSALVTGAGRGMGREVAVAMGELGAAVTVADIDERNAAAVAEAIRESGGEAQSFGVDISQVPSIVALFRQFDDSAQGPLDLLVLAAGVIRPKPFLEHTEADWDYMVDASRWPTT